MKTAQQFIAKKEKEFKSKPKKEIPMKDIGREGINYFICAARTYLIQSNLPEKILIVERLEFIRSEGKSAYANHKFDIHEYRIAYYIIGKIGNRKGKWTWGQFCPLIPKSDFNKLMKKARSEKTILE